MNHLTDNRMRQIAYLIGFFLIWYIALLSGCILDHQPDASVENPPSNEELEESIRAFECLVPEPTVEGVLIGVAVSLAAAYLGLQD